ncbi:MucBP domain-containing protein [Streptococcus suis]
MHHSRRKSFDWYGLKQHFSIRKYHFGAASVLLGMSIALGTGTQVVQAAETVTTPESTSVASSTSATESTTSETSTETATSSSSERTVEIGYIVKYATEEGTLVNASVETVSVTTTETIAKATVSVTAVVPEGYELAAGQAATVSQEVTENGVNIVTVKVVKKAEEKAATSETTTTASTETATAKSTEDAATTTATVSEAVKTPATVEEAKVVLEQVISEAEVLASEGTRQLAKVPAELKEAETPKALEEAVKSTEEAAKEATTTFKNDLATLEEINEKIQEIRNNVEALGLQLRKLTGKDYIEVAMTTTTKTPTVTNMADSTNRSGYWTEYEEVLNKEEATLVATMKPQEQNIPTGYAVDPTDGRITFLIYSLFAPDEDAKVPAGQADGSYNHRYGTDYYITLSQDRVKSTGKIYARLVSQQKGFLEEIEMEEDTARHQFTTILNGPSDKGKFSFRMSFTTMPFTESTGETSTLRYVNINSGLGETAKGSVAYALLTSDTTSYNSYTGLAPSYSPAQITSYYVKETNHRSEELLATYSHTALVSGDMFTISGPAKFENYELIESPEIKDTPVSVNYTVGTPLIQYFPERKTARVIYTTKEEGTARFLNFVLNPDHPDFLDNFKNYHLMNQVDFVTKGGAEALDFANRIAIIDKYLAEIDAVKADTSLSSSEQDSRLADIRANYASEINTDDNKFLLTFVSTETDPRTANNGPDAVTGLKTWNHTVKNYYTNGKRGTNIELKLISNANYPLVDWSPTGATSTGVLLHSKTELNEKGEPLRLSIPLDDNTTVRGDVHTNIIAMFNMLTVNKNNQDYYYAEKGGVKVYYVDSTGKEIKEPQFVYEHKDTHTAYDTKSVKDEKITTADGTVYYYKEIDTTGLKPASSNTDTEKRTIEKITEEVGTVAQDTLKEMTYVYEKAGNVVVNYVTEGGTELSGITDKGTPTESTVDFVKNGKPGTEYDTNNLKPATIQTADGKTYKYKEVDSTKAQPTGQVEAGVTKEVTYIYQEVKGNVVVKYVDANGKPISGTADKGIDGKEKEVASEVEDTPLSSTTNTGNGYDTTDNRPETITTADGKVYRLVPAATQGNEAGDIVEGTTTVTYVYELVKGDVVVHYEDTKGNKIASDVTDTKVTETGTNYNTKEDNKPEKIVNDETGKVYYILPANEVKAGSAPEEGKVVEGTSHVTYIYQEAGNVVVKYELEDGTQLKDPVKDVENGKPGDKNNPADDYTTTDKIEETITTADGKVYKRVPAKTKGNETGDVEAGETIEVTYIYEEVKSDVVVEYYDTEGNPISGTETGNATSVVDTEDASVGTAYNTDDKKPATITAADGTVYYYKEVKDTSAPTTGKVAETTTTVQYVYEKAGNVVVNYVTEGGTELSGITDKGTPTGSTVDFVKNGKPGTDYDTNNLKPATIQTADGKTYKYKEVDSTKAQPTGQVEAGVTKEVTYIYQEVKGNVVVKYVDANGKPISGTADKGIDGKEKEVASEVEDTPLSSTTNTGGNGYDTTDNRPETITTADGTVYKIVPAATQGNEAGDIVEGTTTVTYVYVEVAKAKGSVVVRYVEAGNESNVLKDPVLDENAVVTGTKYDTTDEGDKPAEIVKDGVRYVLVPSKTTAVDPNGNPVTETGEVAEGTTVVTYKYQKVANWIPQIPGVPAGEEPKVLYPFDPTNPDKPIDPTTPYPDGEVPSIPHVPGFTPVDPKTNEPLKPVVPTDPSKGYVPPTPDETGVDTPIPYVQNGNVVVNYVDENGNVIKAPVKDETDAPAGKSYDTTDNKPVELVTEDGSRYVLIPSKIVGSETGTVEGGKTTEITYVYKKVANWIPQIPGVPAGEEPKVPYPFDPTTPDKPIDPTTPYPDGEVPSIPNVPGYTPVDPKTNEPLKPVDPTDPGKGYVPPTPDDSGVDTPIPYVQNGNVVVNYVTEDGTVIKTPVNDETDAPAGKSYDTTDNKPTEIVTEDGSRYVLIPSKTVGSETGTVEGGKTIEITYVYKKVANWIPQIPGVPAGEEPKVPYPFDPTNPDVPVTPTPDTVIPNVPGYTPVDPKTNEPLKPVDPTDPSKGYVPPTPDESGIDTPIPYVQNGNVVVNYVTEDGTVIKAPVQDETDAPAGKSYDTTDNKPAEIVTEDGSRYVLIPSKTIGTENGTVEGGKTIEITYVYKKVANWIPQIPGVPAGEEPKVPYPFDPTTPDKPIDPTTPYPDGEVPSIPNVPGYTPVDPKTNEPLKPVDPTDPGKGYVPPTPDDSGVDTPIPYVQNGNVVVNYVTEDGTVIKTPVNDETDAPAGKSYDTTDNKPVEIVTEDGSRYVLIPSKTVGSETGTVVGGKTTEVTYVYRKVETPAKKVVTNHVDEDGNPIAPQEEGTTPNKSIPGYEFTGKTVTDPDGNTTHIYRKVTKVVTNHVDEDGNPIAPQEEGTTPNKSIPGYEFTGKTVTDPDGNTTHIYRKVSKPVAPKPQAPVAPTTAKAGAAQLPNTGEASSSATVLGAGMLIAALALAGKRRRNED